MKKLLLLIGNEDTKEFEATNLGPSCPLFAYKDIKRNTKWLCKSIRPTK